MFKEVRIVCTVPEKDYNFIFKDVLPFSSSDGRSCDPCLLDLEKLFVSLLCLPATNLMCSLRESVLDDILLLLTLILLCNCVMSPCLVSLLITTLETCSGITDSRTRRPMISVNIIIFSCFIFSVYNLFSWFSSKTIKFTFYFKSSLPLFYLLTFQYFEAQG